MIKKSQMIGALTVTLLLCNAAYSEGPSEAHDTIDLSPDTLMLLQAEMRELAVASQAMVISYVSGDWKSIQRISEQIRDSYVMERNLTDAQKQELGDKLPERFKRLDKDFHARADRLESAAANANSELVGFHFYKLLETCATCHSEYAASRFSGFSLLETDLHQH
ncbi:MAG: cytochrome c [Gammaproteobacteria bacterium]|nr:cytochrome c [Gammaproteobacteria bacterium]